MEQWIAILTFGSRRYHTQYTEYFRLSGSETEAKKAVERIVVARGGTIEYKFLPLTTWYMKLEHLPL